MAAKLKRIKLGSIIQMGGRMKERSIVSTDVMERGRWCSRMVRFMKEIGRRIEEKGKEQLATRTEIYMKESTMLI